MGRSNATDILGPIELDTNSVTEILDALRKLKHTNNMAQDMLCKIEALQASPSYCEPVMQFLHY